MFSPLEEECYVLIDQRDGGGAKKDELSVVPCLLDTSPVHEAEASWLHQLPRPHVFNDIELGTDVQENTDTPAVTSRKSATTEKSWGGGKGEGNQDPGLLGQGTCSVSS